MAAIQKLSSLARTANVLHRNTNVMVKPNVKMVLMMEMTNVASRNSHSTMTEDVVAAKINGSVRVVIVFPSKDSVTVLTNAEITLMKETVNVALRSSKLTPTRPVVAIQRLKLLVIMASVLSNLKSVTVKLNALINLMKEIRNVASEVSITIALKSVAVIQTLK